MQISTKPISMQHLLERYAYESVNTTRIIETFGKDLPARKSIIQYIEEDLSYYCKAMQITVRARNKEVLPDAIKLFSDILKPTPHFYFVIKSEDTNELLLFVVYKEEK